MRERLEAEPVHVAGAVVNNSKEVAFMLRVRAHLSNPKMWMRGGFYPPEVRQQINRGLYVPVEETPACLLGTALLLEGRVGHSVASWGENLVRKSMGFRSYIDLIRWQDTCTHAELMARLDAAIVKLQNPEEESCTSL